MRRFFFLFKTGFGNAVAQDWWLVVRNHEVLPLKTLKGAEDLIQGRLIVSAVETNPLCRKLYVGAGVGLGDIAQEGWFERLPIVTKAHLEEYFKEMTVPKLQWFRRISTIGVSAGIRQRRVMTDNT